MRQSIIRALDSAHAVRAAMAVTLLLGYFFIFVWAPHPWSWQGIDAYHELARSLARGESFQTTDVPWGYAYYASILYRLFGERIWVPLVIQTTLNALVPLLLFKLTAPLAGRRIATLSALIVGVFSFNTIYASTQASDAICTVLFLAGLLAFARGIREDRLWPIVVSGLVFGVVPQFRPNLVLFPGIMAAAFLLMRPRTLRTVIHAAVFCALVLALQLPWIVRNYQLTGMLLPTSTHGGVQLWYGTLQVGPYLESRAHNPRFHFASAAFTYTSLHRPIIINALNRQCVPGASVPAALVYWTDRDQQQRRVQPGPGWQELRPATYEVPPQPDHTTLYYYFEQIVPGAAGSPFQSPNGGAANPLIVFVSDDHLADLDRHDQVLDMFDLVRLLRHIAWQEPLKTTNELNRKLDLNQDGRIDDADVNVYIRIMVPTSVMGRSAPAGRIQSDGEAVTLQLADGSWIRVPRSFGGRQTDVDVSLDGEMAPALISRHRTFTALSAPPYSPQGPCWPAVEETFNTPFYLAEPHMMQRYMALAIDNINRDPMAFVRASLYRAVRLFVVRGTADQATAYQFRWSAIVYAVGTMLSLAYLAVFFIGVVIAYRRRPRLLLYLVPILYVPATICFVLTNMRYTVTVQPLMFAFIAVAIAAALRLDDEPA
jgi:hypothetical protein